MFKKAAALLLSAVIMAGASSAAFAESEPQTIVVEQEFGASAAKVWDGKSEMEAGQKYVLKKSVTISSKVTIPKGTTLTLNKGVKLGISAKGSLYVKGKLAMKAGSTLSVSGTFYTYKGSTASVSGTVKFNKNKAKVTIGGKLTVNKTGVVSGTPKSIKLGKNGTVVVKGKNTCKKLADLLKTGDSTLEQDKKEIEELITKMMETMLVDGKYYDAVAMAVPEAVLKEAEEEFKESMAEFDTTGEYADMTLEDFMNELFGNLIKPMLDEIGTIKSVKVTVEKLTDYTLSEDEMDLLEDCGKIEKAYAATARADVDMDVNPQYKDQVDLSASEPEEFHVVKIGGRWYFVGTSEIYDF